MNSAIVARVVAEGDGVSSPTLEAMLIAAVSLPSPRKV
jgi:hypothetical protein